jgi:hypothetical protein
VKLHYARKFSEELGTFFVQFLMHCRGAPDMTLAIF